MIANITFIPLILTWFFQLDWNCAPLFLTPYIKCGQLEKARNAAKVPPLLDKIESYSGFLTVDETKNKNLFFWYFPVYKKLTNAPVVLWLQGGPGSSSMKGMLKNGPFALTEAGNLSKRAHSWSGNFHMLYIDNPVGVGFSFVDGEKYAQNKDEAGEDLYQALLQFFTLFPELAEKEFFIAGQSYGGRYVPTLGLIIHRRNQFTNAKINLKGLLIGDGLVDPEFQTQVNFLTQLDLIDSKTLPDLVELEDAYLNAVMREDFYLAEEKIVELSQKIWKIPVNTYNYRDPRILYETAQEEDEALKRLFSRPDVMYRIHTGKLIFTPFNEKVHAIMRGGDGLGKIGPYVQELLENYRILLYNGDLDVICNYQSAEVYANSFKWSGSKDFHTANKVMWRAGGKLAGWAKTGGNLTLAVIKDAGHNAPTDQPERVLELVTQFINDEPIS